LLTERYPGVRIADTPTATTITTIPAGAAEVMYLLTRQASLVVGDVIVGAGGGLELGTTPSAHDLRPLLALRIERVLVSHGAPVTANGADALRALIEALELSL
jgi:hypothetical protein